MTSRGFLNVDQHLKVNLNHSCTSTVRGDQTLPWARWLDTRECVTGNLTCAVLLCGVHVIAQECRATVGKIHKEALGLRLAKD